MLIADARAAKLERSPSIAASVFGMIFDRFGADASLRQRAQVVAVEV
jgi:hypothetical protein